MTRVHGEQVPVGGAEGYLSCLQPCGGIFASRGEQLWRMRAVVAPRTMMNVLVSELPAERSFPEKCY